MRARPAASSGVYSAASRIVSTHNEIYVDSLDTLEIDVVLPGDHFAVSEVYPTVRRAVRAQSSGWWNYLVFLLSLFSALWLFWSTNRDSMI